MDGAGSSGALAGCSDRELLEELARRMNAGPAKPGTGRRPGPKPERKEETPEQRRQNKVKWAEEQLQAARDALNAAHAEKVGEMDSKGLRRKQERVTAHREEVQKRERILRSVTMKAARGED